MSHSKKKYFNNLDAIRFVLAIMVLLGHSMFDVALNSFSSNTYFHDFTHGISNGSQAVAFFFVLSGFLITYLLLQEKENTNKINVQNFYVRRILRIWPVYFVVVIFGYFIYPFAKSLIGWETLITSHWWLDALFLGNFNSIYVHANDLVGNHPMMIGITWSVSIEEQFYLVWPLLFFANRKILPYLIFILLITSCVFIYTNLDKGHIIYYHTFSRVMDLSIGGFVAFFAFYSTYFLKFFKNLPKIAIISIYIIGTLYYIFGHHIAMIGSHLPQRIILCIFYIFIICEQNYADNSFYKAGNWKFGSSQGKYTYGLYMLHPIGIQAALVMFKVLHLDNTTNFFYGIIYSTISIVGGYILAYLSYHYLESFFLKLKTKF